MQGLGACHTAVCFTELSSPSGMGRHLQPYNTIVAVLGFALVLMQGAVTSHAGKSVQSEADVSCTVKQLHHCTGQCTHPIPAVHQVSFV